MFPLGHKAHERRVVPAELMETPGGPHVGDPSPSFILGRPPGGPAPAHIPGLSPFNTFLGLSSVFSHSPTTGDSCLMTLGSVLSSPRAPGSLPQSARVGAAS